MPGKQVPPTVKGAIGKGATGKGAKVAAASSAVPAGLNNPWVVGTVPALLVGVFSPWLGVLPWWAVVWALFFVAIPAAGGNIIDALSVLAEQDYPGQLVRRLAGG